MVRRRRNPSSSTYHSQRTPAVQDGVVLWVAKLGVEAQGLGEPYTVGLLRKKPLGQKGD